MNDKIRIPLEWLRTILVDSAFEQLPKEWEFLSRRGNTLKAKYSKTDEGVEVIDFEYNPDDKD